MTKGFTGTPLPRGRAISVCAAPDELAYMTDAELIALRRALTYALAELWLGSRPSQLLGDLFRLTRAELDRRERTPRPPAA